MDAIISSTVARRAARADRVPSPTRSRAARHEPKLARSHSSRGSMPSDPAIHEAHASSNAHRHGSATSDNGGVVADTNTR